MRGLPRTVALGTLVRCTAGPVPRLEPPDSMDDAAEQPRTGGLRVPGPCGLWRWLTLVVLATACTEPASEPLSYARTTRDLLVDPPAFEVLVANENVAPSIAELQPGRHYLIDGAATLSLVLPPPAEVRFVVDGFEGTRHLRLRAGVDFSAARFMRRRVPDGAFVFEVVIDGVLRSQARIGLPPEDPEHPLATEWVDMDGEDGLELEAGATVMLRTGVVDAAGAVFPAPIGPRVGFGGLRLEQRVERERARASAEAPNLVLIVIDTLRRDRLSTYGYDRPTAPNLDRLAARGTVFESAYATASWTWPSTASLLTGLQVREHGVVNSASSYLADELLTLAEACQDVGLSTAGWSGNPLICARLNFDQGFEQLTTAAGGFKHTDTFFSEVEAWLDRRGDDRFLLYLHIVEPHHPIEPLAEGARLLAADVVDPDQRLSHGAHKAVRDNDLLDEAARPLEELLDAADQRAISDLYDASVWSADHWVGQVVEQLESLGLTDRTLIAVTSDHGEELFDRGHLGHARTLHHEVVRVPLVLAGPGVTAGLRVPEPVSNRRLADYFARRAGGPSLGPGDLLESAPVGPVLFSTRVGVWDGERAVEILGLREGARVLHYALPGDEPEAFDPARLRVFDAHLDPGEVQDLTPPDEARAQALWTLVLEQFDRLEPVGRARVEGASAETLELLERIGYMGR